jgi:hypothetical protein
MMERLRSVETINENRNKERLEVEGKKRKREKIEKQVHQYCRINPITCCVLNTISGNPRKQQGKEYTYPKI